MTDSGTAGSTQANYLILDAIAAERQAPPPQAGEGAEAPCHLQLPCACGGGQGGAGSRRFDAACRVTVPYPRKQPEHHDDIASDAAHSQIDAGRAACEAAQHECDHHDVPDRPGAQPSGEIDTMEPGEQPPVPA